MANQKKQRVQEGRRERPPGPRPDPSSAFSEYTKKDQKSDSQKSQQPPAERQRK